MAFGLVGIFIVVAVVYGMGMRGVAAKTRIESQKYSVVVVSSIDQGRLESAFHS
jgi:hypothetical protein